MYYNPFSRRYFLRGMGISLALPFLPSVMRQAYAAGPSPRFIQIINAHGQFPEQYFTSDTALTAQASSGIFAKPLSAISGNFSPILNSAFTPFQNKFSVVRGLSVLSSDTNGTITNPDHNTTTASTCSGPAENTQGGEGNRPRYPYSVDAIISASAKIYPNPVGLQRHVNFSPSKGGQERWTNWSWTKINGAIQQLPVSRDTAGLLAKFAPLNGAAPPPTNPTQVRNANIMQNVFNDYQALRDSSQISSTDRNALESYMTLIDQVQKGLAVTAPAPACSKPLAESEVDIDAVTRNQINVLVAAMACQLTRVGAISLAANYDPTHGYAHSDGLNKPAYLTKQLQYSKHVAYLLSKMDSITEVSGTLLDNSIVYWGNEYGENNSQPQGDDAHTSRNLPIMVAGGGSGQLQMGYYIDYRKTGGMPLNNLMISFFNAMGLSSADYERDGLVGFGEYLAEASKSLGFDKYLAATEKRKPLPFLYKGVTLG